MFMFVNLNNLSVNTNSANGGTYHRSSKVALAATATSTPSKTCSYCDNQSHPIYRCFAFKKLTIDKQKKFVTTEQLCYSCLVYLMVTLCSSKSACICGKSHHTLLHLKQEITHTQHPITSSGDIDNQLSCTSESLGSQNS